MIGWQQGISPWEQKYEVTAFFFWFPITQLSNLMHISIQVADRLCYGLDSTTTIPQE